MAESQEKEYMLRYRENLLEEEKASDELYQERLATCKECDYLFEAMCKSCGCYVEIRASVRKQNCPYSRWKR